MSSTNKKTLTLVAKKAPIDQDPLTNQDALALIDRKAPRDQNALAN